MKGSEVEGRCVVKRQLMLFGAQTDTGIYHGRFEYIYHDFCKM